MLRLELHLLLEPSWYVITSLRRVLKTSFILKSINTHVSGLVCSMMLQTLSSWATSSVEEVASTGPGIRFFQLYVSNLTRLSINLVALDDLHAMFVLS